MLKSNKLSIAVFIASGLLSSATTLAEPELYGRFSLGLVNTYDTGLKDRVSRVENQASRLGIKGKQALEHNLKLIYQYEAGIDPADSTKPIFSLRNSFAGIEGAYGQLIMGTFDTPLKQAQGKVDLFNDTVFDQSQLLASEVRHKQSVQYQSPKLLGGLTTRVDWLPADKADADDGISASVEYASKGYQLTLAMDSKVAGDGGVVTAKANPLNTVRAVLSVKATESISLGLLAQQAEGIDADKSKEIGWLFSTAWQLNKLKLKAQVGQGLADTEANGASSDASITQMTLGADYTLAANTTAFVYTGVNRFEDGAGGTQVGDSRTDSSTGLGLTYKF